MQYDDDTDEPLTGQSGIGDYLQSDHPKCSRCGVELEENELHYSIYNDDDRVYCSDCWTYLESKYYPDERSEDID